jgi:hypothetical protein
MDAGSDSGTLRLGSDASLDAGSSRDADDATVADGGGIDYGIDAGIDISTACLGGNDTFVIAGDGFVHSGPPYVWTMSGQGYVLEWATDGRPSKVEIRYPFTMDVSAVFSTDSLWHKDGFEPRVYRDAVRDQSKVDGHPGLDISDGSHMCTQLTGEFQVIDIATDGKFGTLKSFTATFKQSCNDAGANVGCVHFSQ